MMMHDYQKSHAQFERTAQFVPAGVSTNTRARMPHPLYFAGAEGARVRDLDGNLHLDLVMGNGAIMLGHGHAEVTEAVVRAARSGLTCGVESALMPEAAETLLAAARWPDLVRFTNTGTEAVQHALHIARHATGRTRIAKVEGSYHGWSDEVFVSVWVDPSAAGPDSAPEPRPQFDGQRRDLAADVLVLPFNNIDATAQALRQHGEQLAAIVLEPTLIDVGFIPGRADYLAALRKEADRHGIVLVFDELLTGFNLDVGGAAGLTGVTPDLALFGKAIANGYPLAAVAGREDLMRLTEPGKGPAFVGTFNGHAVSMAAAAAALPILARGNLQKELSRRCQRLKLSFESEARRLGIPARLVTGGSHFHWYFCDLEVTDFRAAARTDALAYGAFAGSLADSRLIVLPNPLSHHAISLAHDDAVLDEMETAFADGLAAADALV